jgi:hypothetical protein
MNPELGGYAYVTEDGKYIYIRGDYGTSATIAITRVEEMVTLFNLDNVKRYGKDMDTLTLRQITGSAGPSYQFVMFYNRWLHEPSEVELEYRDRLGLYPYD